MFSEQFSNVAGYFFLQILSTLDIYKFSIIQRRIRIVIVILICDPDSKLIILDLDPVS